MLRRLEQTIGPRTPTFAKLFWKRIRLKLVHKQKLTEPILDFTGCKHRAMVQCR